MADLILFKVKFIGDGPYDDHVHVVARGYDHAEQLALGYIRTLSREHSPSDEVDETFITAIKRVADSSEFGGLRISSPGAVANLKPVS